MQQKALSLTDANTLFLVDAEARRLSPRTQTFYRARMRQFLMWCDEQGLSSLADVTPHSIRLFQISLQKRDLSSKYQHGISGVLRTFFNFCVREGLIEESPFENVQMPRLDKKILPSFSPEEIRRILDACLHPRDVAIVLTLLDSGLRASELINLNGGDINTKTGTIMVRSGKGQKDRVTRIGARTRKALLRYYMEREHPQEGEAVFVSFKTDKRLTLSGLEQIMKRLRKRSEVEHCMAHTFRRTFAITCLRNGMNIHVLARLMGHADITMLRQYLPLVEDDLNDAHDRHGPVDHML